MDIRQITPRYHVAPQIDPAEIGEIAEAGFTTIICNRPDEEVPASYGADAMEDAARAAGLAFHRLPLTHQTMTPDRIAAQRALIDTAEGKVLAYCASGTRSSVIWSLGQAGIMPVEDIMAATAQAGYDLSGLRPQIAALAASSES